jgi:hypothetical protein
MSLQLTPLKILMCKGVQLTVLNHFTNVRTLLLDKLYKAARGKGVE